MLYVKIDDYEVVVWFEVFRCCYDVDYFGNFVSFEIFYFVVVWSWYEI